MISRFVIVLTLLTAMACGRGKFQNSIPLSLRDRVIDQAHVITQTEKDSIYSLIKDLEENIGSQIAVLTIDTLNGEDMNTFSIRTAEEMQLGRDKYLDGVLMIFAMKDRLMRIEVGSGLERILKDEIMSTINREVIAPKLKQGKYGQGIYLGIKEVNYLIEQNKELVGQEGVREVQ